MLFQNHFPHSTKPLDPSGSHYRPEVARERNKRQKHHLIRYQLAQAPQSEVVAQLSKKKQEITETPPMAVSIALAPPAVESMPRSKKKRALASEIDGESEEDLGNVEFWLLF